MFDQNMAISCAVKTCRNHNKNCDLSFYTFPFPRKHSTTEQDQLFAVRLAKWRKATGCTKPLNRSLRICAKHFVNGKPSKLNQPGDVDWVPSLHLPHQPSSLECKSTEKKNKLRTICSVKYCETNNRPNWKPKLFPFPKLDTTDYVRRVLSEKRILIWLQLLATGCDDVDLSKLQLCSSHFTTGYQAELSDVKNVDWIPTVNMTKKSRITNHVEHFDLYNLISLTNDTKTTIPSCKAPGNISKFQANSVEDTKEAKQATKPLALPTKTKICVGLKCILCLNTSMLKALKPENRNVIEILFNDKLRVESELICANCSKSVDAFFTFYKSVLLNQESATVSQLKNTISIPEGAIKRSEAAACLSTPIVKKRRTIDEKSGQLFELLTTNEYQCKLCETILSTKPVVNDHLFQVHKIKISCKICRISFSPEGYSKHKIACFSHNKARKQTKVSDVAKTSRANTIAPRKLNITPSNQKYSCYICKEYYTPDEMKAHVQTHGINSGIKPDVVKYYEVCKLCKIAVLKEDMQKHMKEHETYQNQLETMLSEEENQKFKCFECSKELKSLAWLETHKAKHKLINLDDKIECPDCSRVMTAKNFKFHVQLVHDNDLLLCEKCGKQFSRASLKKHRSTTCGDDLMVSCEKCGKVMREYVLKSHISKVHSTKPVKCSFCPKEFVSKEYTNSHERYSHREEWDKRKQEGVKRLDLNRDQLQEALGIKSNGNEDDNLSTCPIYLNFHGKKLCVEQHVRKDHYMSMNHGGIIVSNLDIERDNFDSEESMDVVLQTNEETDTLEQ